MGTKQKGSFAIEKEFRLDQQINETANSNL
jgi:hypothetical protein